MKKEVILKVKQELEVEFKHISDYLTALARGTPADPHIPPALKAKVDSVIVKHSDIANPPHRA